jgi:hypothetical protein
MVIPHFNGGSLIVGGKTGTIGGAESDFIYNISNGVILSMPISVPAFRKCRLRPPC